MITIYSENVSLRRMWIKQCTTCRKFKQARSHVLPEIHTINGTWHSSWSLQVLSALQHREYNCEWKLINAVRRIKSILYYYVSMQCHTSKLMNVYWIFMKLNFLSLGIKNWQLQISPPKYQNYFFDGKLIKYAWNYCSIKRKMWKTFFDEFWIRWNNLWKNILIKKKLF